LLLAAASMLTIPTEDDCPPLRHGVLQVAGADSQRLCCVAFCGVSSDSDDDNTTGRLLCGAGGNTEVDARVEC
jgi:hypothetical protein